MTSLEICPTGGTASIINGWLRWEDEDGDLDGVLDLSRVVFLLQGDGGRYDIFSEGVPVALSAPEEVGTLIEQCLLTRAPAEDDCASEDEGLLS